MQPGPLDGKQGCETSGRTQLCASATVHVNFVENGARRREPWTEDRSGGGSRPRSAKHREKEHQSASKAHECKMMCHRRLLCLICGRPQARTRQNNRQVRNCGLQRSADQSCRSATGGKPAATTNAAAETSAFKAGRQKREAVRSRVPRPATRAVCRCAVRQGRSPRSASRLPRSSRRDRECASARR